MVQSISTQMALIIEWIFLCENNTFLVQFLLSKFLNRSFKKIMFNI